MYQSVSVLASQKHLLRLNSLSWDVWLPVCSTHLSLVEVDISPQGELSNLGEYKKSFITMLRVFSKMINSLFEDKS